MIGYIRYKHVKHLPIGVEVFIHNIWVWKNLNYIPSSATRVKVSFNKKDIVFDDDTSVLVEKCIILELI